MDLKNTARKFISFPSDSDEEYNGPYVVRPQQLDFLVRNPHSFKDAEDYGKELMDGKAVLISFRSVDRETKIRIFDYLCGVAYIMHANVVNVKENFMLYAPQRVAIDKVSKHKTSLWKR